MEMKRRATLVLILDNDNPDLADLAQAWGSAEFPVEVTLSGDADDTLRRHLQSGEVQIQLRLDKPGALSETASPSPWLGEIDVQSFLVSHIGYTTSGARSTTITRRISGALVDLALANGVTVICSRCRQDVRACSFCNGSNRHGGHPCAYAEELVSLVQLERLRGMEPPPGTINRDRTRGLFRGYLEYLLEGAAQ